MTGKSDSAFLFSSVPLPKDAGYFRNEREIVIKKSMEVCSSKSDGSQVCKCLVILRTYLVSLIYALLLKNSQVYEAKPLVVQAQQMKRELDTTQLSDYTAESLPLLLLQVSHSF